MNPAEFANIANAEQQFWWYRGMNRMLFRLLDPLVASRKIVDVLEAGCGTGYLSSLLQDRYGWRMYPVDLGMEGLRYGRTLDLKRLAQADIAKLPFNDSTFDAVLSMDVIVHFPRGEEKLAMSEITRVLRPGGLLAIRVSALDALRSRHSMFAHERQRFTRSRLSELAQGSGIQVKRCTYANALLLPVAFAKFRIWEPLIRQAPSSGVAAVAPWLNQLLYRFLALETKWLGSGGNFPLGQSLILIGEKKN